ncbi:MAG: 1-acyl-sn-glycerol-3-phosphate acyltransferase [Lachnospiraceae bacterium]|nr:1-acyl-sn-glycerol-3-phosphate acyltransferase [Lachnospiraceae bacterium]
MKIKTRASSYQQVMDIPVPAHRKPMKQLFLFRLILRIASIPDLFFTRFKCTKIGMERLGKKQPCLILMNHSSFIDLEIASTILFPRPFNIVCTTDGFVGKNWLMRLLGCIPTKKFMQDVNLVRDMVYATKTLKSSVLMYPEASYSFDGTATPLPDSLGKCIKLMGVPVVVIQTQGAFSRDPLYNNLQKRKVKVSATMQYVLSPEDIAEKSAAEINEIVQSHFAFDGFKWQQENQVRIKEKFRADCLNRVLYKCPNCNTEGKMVGKGIHLTCHHCLKQYELTEMGYIKALEGETEFEHVPDWYQWERECVKAELENGTYKLDVPVKIYMMVDTKCVYKVGEGRLTHTVEGFSLQGCDGAIDYKQSPKSSYSLYSDYYWYEIGDMISIGDDRAQFYLFPTEGGDIVAKTRLAAEELYKLVAIKRKKA